jgi:hypothetical protein
MKLNYKNFWNEWNGHLMEDLKIVLEELKQDKKESIIYLAGDSSLDNKFWLGNNYR